MGFLCIGLVVWSNGYEVYDCCVLYVIIFMFPIITAHITALFLIFFSSSTFPKHEAVMSNSTSFISFLEKLDPHNFILPRELFNSSLDVRLDLGLN